MNKKAGLSHTYDAGSQQWFEKKNFFGQDGRLRRYGCGVIAAADYCMYRGIEPRADTREAYLAAVRGLERRYLHVIPGFGLSAILYPAMMNILLWKKRAGERLRGRSFFFLSERGMRRLLSIVQCQLADDCPVIMILGSAPFWHKKRKGVTLYRLCGDGMKPAAAHVSAHFITVTGICEMPGIGTFFEVYSWGTRYYLSPEEYERSARYTYPFSSRVYCTRLRKGSKKVLHERSRNHASSSAEQKERDAARGREGNRRGVCEGLCEGVRDCFLY